MHVCMDAYKYPNMYVHSHSRMRVCACVRMYVGYAWAYTLFLASRLIYLASFNKVGSKRRILVVEFCLLAAEQPCNVSVRACVRAYVCVRAYMSVCAEVEHGIKKKHLSVHYSL